jgi:hypothetical protein
MAEGEEDCRLMGEGSELRHENPETALFRAKPTAFFKANEMYESTISTKTILRKKK